jgi:DNA ligase 1
MKRFTALYRALDETTRSSEKVAHLRDYFREAPPKDAAWALSLLLGRRGRRGVSSPRLRAWVAERAELPEWLVDTCYDTVGDLAETLALLLPPPPADAPPPPPLHAAMEAWVLPLPGLDEEARRTRVEGAWDGLDAAERFVFHKLLTGGFRVGVSSGLVLRALGAESGVDPAVLAHRLSGTWTPSGAAFEALVRPDEGTADPARPYPFLLAHPVEGDPAELLGPDLARWLLEWKWDGIRGQLVVRDGALLLWSRGEESIAHTFPEVVDAARTSIPLGTVLDGELLAWEPGAPHPLPFASLQRRLGRKAPPERLKREVPVRFVAYDILEHEGADIRHLPLRARREILDALFDGLPAQNGAGPLALSHPLATPADPDAAKGLRERARVHHAEGLMVKDLEGIYGVGRPRGLWWKWKVDPHTLDAVLLYAQKGHGRRANLYTDYTLGIWDHRASPPTLVPVAKAYSGLTDRELAEVDRWIRQNRLERFGPVQSVRPELVFEIAFEGIRPSPRHRAGVALRFPRIARWRTDKTAADADTLERVRALLEVDPA